MIQKIKKFGLNTSGRDYAVGDIHGCFSLLQEALDKIGFDSEKDRLFSVGDLADRGPESHLAVEWLGKPWFHAICGNHEAMLIGVSNRQWPLDNFFRNGGTWIANLSEDELNVFAFMFSELPLVMEVMTLDGPVGLTHAQCPVDDWNDLEAALGGPNGEGYEDVCLWSRDKIEVMDHTPVKNIRAVIHGHTPRDKTVRLGNTLYIDTGASFWERRGENHLTIIELSDLEVVHGPT